MADRLNDRPAMGPDGSLVRPAIDRAPFISWQNDIEVEVTKRYDEEIEVAVDPYDGGSPLAFVWRGRRYDIDDRLETWREAGEWWQSSNPRDREYFRVLARPSGLTSTGELDTDGFMAQIGAVYDLYRDRNARAWRIARIWD